jgi:lycopene beta-cyclase
VEGHPFDVDTMLFMDWRDDHLADLPEVKARNDKLPTFLYAMPFSKNKVGGRHAVGSQPVLRTCCLPFT